MARLKLVLPLLAVWLLVCAILSLIWAGFGAGFRDGFFGGMNNDFNRIKNAFGSPLGYWLFVLVSVYLLSFLPVMLLATTTGVISPKIIARLYLPIWFAIGLVLLSLDWLRGNGDGDPQANGRSPAGNSPPGGNGPAGG